MLKLKFPSPTTSILHMQITACICCRQPNVCAFLRPESQERVANATASEFGKASDSYMEPIGGQYSGTGTMSSKKNVIAAAAPGSFTSPAFQSRPTAIPLFRMRPAEQRGRDNFGRYRSGVHLSKLKTIHNTNQ